LLEFILHAFGSFLPLDDWRSRENLSTEISRYLHGPEFDNFGGGNNFREFWLAFLSEKPGWVLMDGRMQE